MYTPPPRWLNAVKVSHAARGANQVEAAAKAELLKNEMEEETYKFDQLQDSLATEMFTFIAKEKEYAEWIMKVSDTFNIMISTNFDI